MTIQSEAEVFARVRAAICERFGFPPDIVTMNTHLYDTLEFDSLDTIDLVIDLEKLAGRRIREEELGDIDTVGDAVRAAHKILNA